MNHHSEITRLPVIAPKPKSSTRAEATSTSAAPPKRERRATPRLKVELECEEQVGSSRYFRITTDLSTFGLSTRQGYPHKVGTRLRLRIYLPDGKKEPVELDAEVVGVFAQDSKMRLAFRNPSIEAVRRIHRYLMSRTAPRRSP